METLHLIEQSVKEILTAHVERHAPSAFWLAYSGGLDSTVLLHVVSHLKDEFSEIPVTAIHVHHGLQEEADQWVVHCEQQCRQRGIPLVVKHVDAQVSNGESPEALARELRYAAIAEEMDDGALLLLGQHQDDQIETVMLQLLRGAGPRGLAAMAELSTWRHGFKLRPLLSRTRLELETYAQEQGLQWVEDPSNQSAEYDRNYLRHSVIPLLKENWPGMGKTLSRSAVLCAEADELSGDLAKLDAQTCNLERNTLDISGLATLTPARRRNLLRYWAMHSDMPVPTFQALIQIEQQLLSARDDAQPQVEWAGVSARRYRDTLYLVNSLSALPKLDLPWHIKEDLPVPGLGTLIVQQAQGRGLSREKLGRSALQVRFRCGGEQIKPQGDVHTRPLQKLMQREGIPPWLRERIPLIYIENELIAVVGYWYSDEYAAEKDEMGLYIKLLNDCQ